MVELQLQSAGFDVEKTGTAEEGLRLADRADLVLTDLQLPGMDGLALLELLRRQNSQLPVIVMTAYGTVETAVEAMKAGAVDFLLKPFSLDHLMEVVNKALEVRALRDENRKLREELGWRYEFDNIVGRQSGDAGDFFDAAPGGADQSHRAAGGRERRGQGSDRARDALSFAAARPSVRQDQLLGDSRKPDGE